MELNCCNRHRKNKGDGLHGRLPGKFFGGFEIYFFNGADSAAESMDPRPNSPATKRWSEESALVVATGSSGT